MWCHDGVVKRGGTWSSAVVVQPVRWMVAVRHDCPVRPLVVVWILKALVNVTQDFLST